jgi:hypothetical protein
MLYSSIKNLSYIYESFQTGSTLKTIHLKVDLQEVLADQAFMNDL